MIAGHGGGYRWARGWFDVIAISWVHLIVINWLNYKTAGVDSQLMVLGLLALVGVPAIVTAAVIPAARSGIWRWGIVYSLLAFAAGESAMVILLAGHSTLLHRYWVSVRRHGYQWAPTTAVTS